MFLAEKGVTLPTTQIDLRAGEQFSVAFRQLNPGCTVPVLELDDGTTISEAIAVCRYLEVTYPEPPLMGRSAKEQGVIAMWEHRCEIDGFLAVVEAFRNAVPRMQGHALAGPTEYAQIPALAERGRARIRAFFALLDERLASCPFIAGEAFSVADITALITVDFAAWIKTTIADNQTHLRRWNEVVSARPSAQA
jgi:glutathione S-transferase